MVEKPQGHVTAADLQESQQIIINRVNGLGVSNSNVTIQGNNIVIELPGAKNDTEVLQVVGPDGPAVLPSGGLHHRPVPGPTSSTTTTTPQSGTTTTTVNPKTTTPAATKTTKAAAGAVGGPRVHLPDAHLASASFPLAAGTSTTARRQPGSTTSTVQATPTTVPHPLIADPVGDSRSAG